MVERGDGGGPVRGPRPKRPGPRIGQRPWSDGASPTTWRAVKSIRESTRRHYCPVCGQKLKHCMCPKED